MIEARKRIYPVEMKLSSTIDYGKTKSLVKWLEISKIKDVRGLIISSSKQMGLVGNNVANCHYSLV